MLTIHINCHYSESRKGLINELMTLEVEPKQKIEDLITLLSVQNNKIDFDKCKIKLNQATLPRNKSF